MDRIYSRHAVRECLRAKRRDFHKLWIAEGTDDAPVLREITQLAAAAHVPVASAKRDALNAITPHHQGVILDAGAYPYDDLDAIFERAETRNEPPFVLVLDAIQDTQNFGALIRTAEAVGVHGVIIPDRRSAGVTPAVVNASSGASEHMLIASVVNLTRAIEALKKREIWVSALDGGPGAQALFKADLKGPLAIVVGSEGEGVHRLVRETCDFVLSLPMHGHIESLNAAMAGSVALYEALRQRSGQ
jgi:23S rRNA (guanosine2251-2'-O)-methyltransferase